MAWVLRVHLVFVTKYRHGVFDDDMLRFCELPVRKACGDFEAVLRGFNGEPDHVHLLAGYPPKVSVSALVNSLKGGVGAAAAAAVHGEGEPRADERPLLVSVVRRRVLRRRP